MEANIDRSRKVIVVLGGGLNPDNSPTPKMVARLETGLALYQTGEYPWLITTSRGTFRDTARPIAEAEVGKDWLVSNGIPSEVILPETESMDTLGNAYFTRARYLDPKGFTSPTIITNEFHAGRVKLLFDLVLGDRFNPEYVAVEDRGLSTEDLAKWSMHEETQRAFYSWYFCGTAKGDMSAIGRYIHHINPAHTGFKDPIHRDLSRRIHQIWS